MGRRLAALPTLAAVAGRLDDATTAGFADHEAEVVPVLVPLSPRQVSRAMAAWKDRVRDDQAPPPEPPQQRRRRHRHRQPGPGVLAPPPPPAHGRVVGETGADGTFEVTDADGRHRVTRPPGADPPRWAA